MAEVTWVSIRPRSTGRSTGKTRQQTARGLSMEGLDAFPRQVEAESEDPPVPERFLPGECRLLLAQGPSMEGSDSVPRIVPYEVGESTERSDNSRTSPHRGSAVHTPHGQVTKPPSPQAGPAAALDEEIGLVGPSSPGKKVALRSKPPNPPRTKHCPTCGKACQSIKILNKHMKEVRQPVHLQVVPQEVQNQGKQSKT